MDNLKDWVDYGVLGVLGLMSLISLTFFLERFFYYRYVRIEAFTSRIELEINLSKRLTTIATIASNAPYVGLLGTVLGIMLTFMSMGQGGVKDAEELMVGLGLALKATAFGLVVAIPSIIFYNMLTRQCEVRLAKWDVLQEKQP